MRNVIEALRLTFDQKLSQRAVAQSLGLSQGSVTYLTRFAASGFLWPLPPEIGEAELETRLFTRPSTPAPATRPVPDWATVQQELKRKGVTLQLLWVEYKAGHPGGYQYTQFCRHYHAWAATIDPVLRQVYVAGERTFVDYAGLTMPIWEAPSSDARAAQIFVGALGASGRFEYAGKPIKRRASSMNGQCCTEIASLSNHAMDANLDANHLLPSVDSSNLYRCSNSVTPPELSVYRTP